MDGLMMDYPLTIPALLRRAETLYGRREVVSRLADRSLHRYTLGECLVRARRLGAALRRLGVAEGDRVATFAWNNYAHLEAYLGVPSVGAVVHTLNIRLHADELSYIASHAGDRVAIVDASLLPAFEAFRRRAPFEHVIVYGDAGETASHSHLEYEALLGAEAKPSGEWPELDERSAAVLCYTSGTTGRPKGVLYSHRALMLHSLGAIAADGFGFGPADTVLPVVPMFHANGWGLPFTAPLVGAKLVLPGPFMDPNSLLELIERERVTHAFGVPTIWNGILQALDAAPGARDVSSLRMMGVGGSAVPRSMIEAFQERHGLRVTQGWGMTETSPIASVAALPAELRDAPAAERYTYLTRQGMPLPFIEIRARNTEGLVPWDGETAGELEVRGPWIAASYYDSPESADRFTADGWFRTGDVVTIDKHGSILITDRIKDLIKSGGEWISSIALENALMGHPAVAEAAVIAVPDEKWSERPLAAVALRPGKSASARELRAFIAPQFPAWWLPERFEFVDEIPRTSVGKFLKSALRERFAGGEAAPVPPPSATSARGP